MVVCLICTINYLWGILNEDFIRLQLSGEAHQGERACPHLHVLILQFVDSLQQFLHVIYCVTEYGCSVHLLIIMCRCLVVLITYILHNKSNHLYYWSYINPQKLVH